MVSPWDLRAPRSPAARPGVFRARIGDGGPSDLPGEHGFRFPSLSPRHRHDGPDALRTVRDCRRQSSGYDSLSVGALWAPRGGADCPLPRSLNDVRVVLDDFGRLLGGDLGLNHEELGFFASKIWQIVTSCHERRMNDYEKIGWWDFIEAQGRSPAYQKLLGHGITRSLVAAKARSASTKTIGDVFVQLLFDIVTPGPSTDRVLNGPTNDVWINPWLKYLQSKGVAYHVNSKVSAVTFDGARVRGATIDRGGSSVTVTGDYFIFAMPVEDVIDLITPEMVRAEPALAHLFTLDDITEWMNGIQIYLTEEVPITTAILFSSTRPGPSRRFLRRSSGSKWIWRPSATARSRELFRWTSQSGSRRG